MYNSSNNKKIETITFSDQINTPTHTHPQDSIFSSKIEFSWMQFQLCLFDQVFWRCDISDETIVMIEFDHFNWYILFGVSDANDCKRFLFHVVKLFITNYPRGNQWKSRTARFCLLSVVCAKQPFMDKNPMTLGCWVHRRTLPVNMLQLEMHRIRKIKSLIFTHFQRTPICVSRCSYWNGYASFVAMVYSDVHKVWLLGLRLQSPDVW